MSSIDTALLKTFSLTLVTIALTAALIYLTPLRTLHFRDPAIREIDPKVLYAAMQKDPREYLLIDVGLPGTFSQQHAAGSINVQLYQLYYQRSVLPKQNTKIVLINADSSSSSIGYIYLQQYGFTNISIVKGGLAKWKEEGLPLAGHTVPAS